MAGKVSGCPCALLCKSDMVDTIASLKAQNMMIVGLCRCHSVAIILRDGAQLVGGKPRDGAL